MNFIRKHCRALLVLVIAWATGWTSGVLLSERQSPLTQAQLITLKEPSSPTSAASKDAAAITAFDGEISRKVKALELRIQFLKTPLSGSSEVYQFAQTLTAKEFAPALAELIRGFEIHGINYSDSRVPAQMLAGYWMELDPVAALAWFEKLPVSLQKDFSSAILNTWANKQPSEMLSWAEHLPPERLKELLAQKIGDITKEGIDPSNADRFIKLAERATDSNLVGRYYYGQSETPSDIDALFRNYSKSAPLDALSRAMQLPSGSWRTQALAGLAFGWATADPTAAQHWAETINDPAITSYIFSACAKGMAQNDVAGAVEWLGSLADTSANQKTLQELLSSWTDQNPTAALQWVDEFPPGTDSAKYYRSIFKELPLVDPENTIAIVLDRFHNGKSIGPEDTWNSLSFQFYVPLKGVPETLATAELLPQGQPTLKNMYDCLILYAADLNFNEVSKWALQQPDDKRRSEALSELAQVALHQGTAEALKWGQSLPMGSGDAARATLANNFHYSDFDAAVKLYQQNSDQAASHKSLTALMSSWLDSDPIQAANWLKKSDTFSSEEKATLLKKGANP
jgi:hypothetical protein